MSSPKSERYNIVVLDGYTLNPGDLSWSMLEALGNVQIYDHSEESEIVPRAKKADIILANKIDITAQVITALPRLKCICVTATGINNIDLAAAEKRNIPVFNASGYGTSSVAQHVFALLLEMTNRVYEHHQSVQKGDWSGQRDFSYWLHSIPELDGKIMGIYGLGRIGQKVADIATAFGMKVIAHHKHPQRDARPDVSFVDLQTLFAQSDVISLHAPLNKENEGIVDQNLLKHMKPSAYLINTGRGGLINDKDLKVYLEEKRIAGAALDVLDEEPPPRRHMLMGLDNCLITPHMAWATQAARQRLMEITVENVASFLQDL